MNFFYCYRLPCFQNCLLNLPHKSKRVLYVSQLKLKCCHGLGPRLLPGLRLRPNSCHHIINRQKLRETTGTICGEYYLVYKQRLCSFSSFFSSLSLTYVANWTVRRSGLYTRANLAQESPVQMLPVSWAQPMDAAIIFKSYRLLGIGYGYNLRILMTR